MDLGAGFRVGDWEVFPLSGDIRSDGAAVHLEPKVMEVLVALAEQAGNVVTRDELLNRIWGNRAAISDEPLTRCIAQLRQALGDSSRNPKYIQTVPKRGYWLIQQVEPLGQGGSPAPQAEADVPPPAGHRGPGLNRWQLAASLAGLAVLGYVAYILLSTGYGPANIQQAWSPRCNLEQTEAPDRYISPQARELCEEGLGETDRRGPDSLYTAIRIFELAVQEQENYGSAIINLARALVLYPTYEENAYPDDCVVDPRYPDPRDCFDAALNLLENRMFDAEYIEKYTHGIRGYVYTKQRRWEAARYQFERAVELTPLDADMRQWYSQLLASVGDLEGALEMAQTAVDLDPTSAVLVDRLVVMLMWLDYTEQARELSEQRESNPDFLTHNPYPESQLVLAVRLENWDELKRQLVALAFVRRSDQGWIDDFILGLQDPAYHDRAVQAVEFAVANEFLYGQLEYGAWVYLQEADRAMEAALRLVRQDPQGLDPEFLFVAETAILRRHPAFGELIDELGLDDYWSNGAEFCPSSFGPNERERFCEL